MVLIKGIQGISLIDYPGKIASTLFLAGCNFRCLFCHNPELIEKTGNDNIPIDDIMEKLERRENFIEGVCITGGEPLLSDDIFELLDILKKKTHLSIKIDTNGYNNALLKRILDEGRADYIAMDIKTSPKRYYEAAGVDLNSDSIVNAVKMIMDSDVDYEFRTTVVPDIVTTEDMREIGTLIEGAQKYVLQQFRRDKTLDQSYSEKFPYRPAELVKMKDIIKQFVDNVEIRGI